MDSVQGAVVKSYPLTTIADLLTVPVEARERCLHELAYALALHEFVFTDKAKESLQLPVTWTDDGDSSASITVNGKPLCSLVVTNG